MSRLDPLLVDAERRYESSDRECASSWVSTYFFLRDVEDNGLWRFNYKSFHAWLTDYVKRQGANNYPVFRRRLNAGHFYDDVIIGQRKGFFPPIENLEVSAESILIVQKIYEIDEHVAINALTDLIMGNIGRKDLEAIYDDTRSYEPKDGVVSKTQSARRPQTFEEDIEISEIPGLSRAEIQQVLEDKGSWVYRRISAVLGGNNKLEIKPSAIKLLTTATFGLDRGDQDLWEALRPYVYRAKDALNVGETHLMLYGSPELGLHLESDTLGYHVEEPRATNDMPSTVKKRGPKPQPWYDRKTARLIDTLLGFKINLNNISSLKLHQIASYLSGGPGTDEVVPTYDDRDAAQLLWFALIVMTYANGFYGNSGEITLGSLNGIIENGNKILVGTTTRLDFLFYSTEEEGREGFEQKLCRGHVQLSRLAVEALSSYRRFRELTFKQRERATAVASSLLNQALLDSIQGGTDVPKELLAIAEQ